MGKRTAHTDLRRWIFIMAVWPLCGGVMCMGQRTVLSLQDCMDMALTHSSAVKNARLDVDLSVEQQREALANYFPNVSLGALAYRAQKPMIELGITDILGSGIYVQELENTLVMLGGQYGFKPYYRGLQGGYTANVTAVQPLFAGGRIVNGNRLASLGVKAAVLQEKIEVRQLGETVENSYWQIVSLCEKLKTLSELDRLLQSVENDVRTALSAGLVTETDLLTVQLKRDELETGRIRVENGIRLSKMNLFNTIGFSYNPYTNVDLDSVPHLDEVVLGDTLGDMLPPETYYVSEDEVVSALEEIKLLDLQVDAGRLMKKMAVGEALPQVGIGASYGYADIIGKGKFNGMVFASVSVPLSDWGAAAHKMHKEEYKIRKAENDRDFLGQQLLLQVRQLWLNITSAWAQLQVAGQSVKTAEKVYGQYSEHYRAGVVSISELLQTQSQLRTACDNYVDRKIEYRTALQAYLRRITTPENL